MSLTLEQKRIRYWSDQMDRAYRFMMAIRRYPVRECGEPLVFLPAAAKAAGVPVVFSRRPFGRRLERLFYLRRELVEPFLRVAEAMQRRGWILKVEDAYRTPAMQSWLNHWPRVYEGVAARVQWECGGGRKPAVALMFQRLTALTATMPKIGTHMSGSALDISVLRRSDRTEVDRGGPYIEISERTPMDTPFISAQARRNRRIISDLMAHAGFLAYPYEFWHYSQGDAYTEFLCRTGQPARYGAVRLVSPRSGAVAPLRQPLKSFVSNAELRVMLQAAGRQAAARRGGGP